MGYGEKDVTVNIKVKDTDVDKAEAKLARLKAAANDVGSGSSGKLTQQEKLAQFLGKDLPTAADKATTGLKDADAAIQGVTEAAANSAGASATAASGFGAIAAAAGITVAGLLVLAGVFVLIADHAYKAAKAFAEYALSIGKLSEESGLATETVSGLTVELEQQGRSFNDIKGQVNEFRKLIGQAAAGSEDARARLNALGIDGKKAINDIDSAFKSAVATIVKAKDPAEQVRLAYAAFGNEGYKLLPFLREFNGNVDAAIAKARQLGLVVGGDDVRAGKEFHKTWTEIGQRLDGIYETFGKALGPAVLRVMNDLNAAAARNQNTFKTWADNVAKFLSDTIATFEAHPYLSFLGGAGAAAIAAQGGVKAPQAPQKLYDYSRPQDIPAGGPDLAALDAARAQQEKELKDAIERNKKDWDAAIKLWEDSGNEAGTTLTRIFSDLKGKLEKDGNIGDFIKGVNAATSGYLTTINQVYSQLEELENERARRNKATDNEIKLLQEEQLKRRKDWAQKAYDIQKDADDLVTKDQKKATEQQLKDLADANSRKDQLDAARTATVTANAKLQFDIGAKTEKEYIDFVNAQELGDARLKLQRAEDYLGKVKGNKAEEAKAELQVGLAKEHVAQTEIANGERTLDYDKRRLEAAEKLKKAYEDLRDSLQDQLDELVRGGRPLSEYEKTVKELERDYKDLDPAQKQNLLNIAAEIDAVKALQAEYEKVKDTIKTMLDYVLRGDFKGLGRALLDQVRNSVSDKLSGILATVITGYDPNSTNNPVAKPIVKEITGTNKRLDTVIKLLGGSSTGGLGGGGLGSILGGINGGSLGGLGGILDNGPGGLPSAAGSGGGTILDRLRNIFSTGQGGIFAPRDNALSGHTSRLGGILGGVGDLATLAGGVIGGRVGGIISSVGTGLSIGASFGPIGAVIGAGIGLLVGLFQGDPKKKADKQQNIPALQKGFGDSITQLNQILDGIRHLTIEPDDAINQALAIRADIAGGFGIQFQSKKYRKQAQTMIAQELVTADNIISQIRASAEIARGAADRSKRILPEFASGTYFADYFRPNGLLPGAFDGRDNILAMISRGEMVLNPNQQRNIRALAGFDVFAGAGIPNYPNPTASPKFASGGIASGGGSIVVQPNFSITMVGVPIGQHIDAYITGDDGKRQLVKVVTKETTANKR